MNGERLLRDVGWKTLNEGVRVKASGLCEGVLYDGMVSVRLQRTNCIWSSKDGPTTDGGLRGRLVPMSDANVSSINNKIH